MIGKFIGIFGLSFLAVKMKLAKLSSDLRWRHIFGIAFLGGIGFTMSIFICNLAFTDPETIVSSKMSILISSFMAAMVGLAILKINAKAKVGSVT